MLSSCVLSCNCHTSDAADWHTGQGCSADLLSDLGMLRVQKICRPDIRLELALYSLDLERVFGSEPAYS